RCALFVQSCSLSRVMDYSKPYSTGFGDGATAVVVGPVSEGRGLLSAHHVSDGELGNTLSVGLPDALWFEAGENTVIIEQEAAFKMMTRLGEYAQNTIPPAEAKADLRPGQVDFYASHQGFCWYRQLTQDFTGLTNAKYFDIFPSTASISAANIPLTLLRAEQQGLLRDDDIVVTQAGGSGLTYSSLVLRWGR
ncbi:MAG: hypothetical protein KC431_16905, partial [Myxococcales bacterium]|nr:hypothetical protein [Myxococcales bacterium]